MEWKEIESAPKNFQILGFAPNKGIVVIQYAGWQGWLTLPGKYGIVPTHWMLLPPSPTASPAASANPEGGK